MPESGCRPNSDGRDVQPRRTLLLALVALSAVVPPPVYAGGGVTQIPIGSRHKPTLTVAGLAFRDLNSNGTLDPFEDWRLTPERDGYDSHNAYGKNSALTAAHLAEHVKPFLGAFAVRVAGVMPTYSVLADLKVNGQRDKANLLLVDFGVSDAALFDVLTGKETASGRLPIELPASMGAVIAQKSDAPHDSEEPLYPIFSGRRLP